MATEAGEAPKPGWMSPLVLLLSAVFMATQLWQPLVVSDEGYAAYCAWRIQVGDLPYRDFFLNYSPGSFYFNALLFKAFGTSIVTLRAGDLLLRLLTAYACGAAAWRAGAGAWSWFAFGGALLCLAGLSMFGYATIPGMLLFFAVGLAWDRHCREGGDRWAVLAGLLVAALLFVRQDFGVYAGAAILLHAAALRCFGAAKGAFRGAALAAVAAALLASALFLPLVHRVGWTRLVDLLVLGPMQLRSGFLVLPLPALGSLLESLRDWTATGRAEALDAAQLWAVFYGSLAALALALAWSLRRLAQGERRAGALLFWGLAGAFLLRQGLNRANLAHLFPMQLMAFACLAPMLGQGGIRRWAAPWGLLFGLFCFLQPLTEWAGYARGLRSLPLSRLERARGLPVPADLEFAVRRVEALALPEERIYVAAADFESSLAPNVLFYFLAGRACASYYESVRLPLPAEEKEALFKALQDPRTAAVVLWDGYGRGFGNAATDLALRAFAPRGEAIGQYILLARRGARR